jgi:hypothetical protein
MLVKLDSVEGKQLLYSRKNGRFSAELNNIHWLWWGETDVSELQPSLAYCSSPGEYKWRAMVMMPAEDNSWLVYQNSLAVLPAETSGASRRNEGMRISRIQYLWYVNGSFVCRKILRQGTSGVTSHPKEGVLRICIAIKNPSPRPVWTYDSWV